MDDPFAALDYESLRKQLVDFLRVELARTGFERTVLGLSGGLDSALVCYLAAEAFGPGKVLGLAMPHRDSSPASLAHARLVAAETGVELAVREITPMVDAFFEGRPDASVLRRGNKMARERMCLLYDLSAEREALVLGTSNLSEIRLGYGTAFGDLACAINPIGGIYKTEVRHLSRLMGVPAEIIDKAPSADLWQGQSDENELGFSYEKVDPLLRLLFDEGYGRDKCLAAGWEAALVDRVLALGRGSEFKRRMPLIAAVQRGGEA